MANWRMRDVCMISVSKRGGNGNLWQSAYKLYFLFSRSTDRNFNNFFFLHENIKMNAKMEECVELCGMKMFHVRDAYVGM